GGGGAAARRSGPLEPVAVMDEVGRAGGGRGEVPEPGGEQRQAEVEDLGAAPAPGPFRLLPDLPRRAPDPGRFFLLERLAGRLLDGGAGVLRRLQQPLPGR